MGLEGPGLGLTRRQALTGLAGLGAAGLLVTGCAPREPTGHALTTAATRRAVPPLGTLLWHVRPPAGLVSLVVADGLLCAGVDAGVYAMHAATGQQAWTRYGDNPIAPFAFHRGVLFGVDLDGVVALYASNGKVLWTAPAGTVNLDLASTWVLVTDGTVCTISEIGPIAQRREVVLGLDSGSGRRKWVADFPSIPRVLTSVGSLVVTGSPVPPFNGSGKVVALDAATGQRRWTTADLHLVPGQIATTENVVVVSTSDNSQSPGRYRTLGLDGATGRELWRVDGSADPLVAGGGLVYGVNRTLWARGARTGRQVWEHAFSQPPAVLAITDGIVLAGSGRQVQALSAASGDQLWSHAIPAYPVAFTTAASVAYVAAERNPLTDQGATDVYAFQA